MVNATTAIPNDAKVSLLGCDPGHPALPASLPAPADGPSTHAIAVDPRPTRDTADAALRALAPGGTFVLTAAVVSLAPLSAPELAAENGAAAESARDAAGAFPTLDALVRTVAAAGFASVRTRGPWPLSSLPQETLAAAGLTAEAAEAAGAHLAAVAVEAAAPAFELGAAQPLRKKKGAAKVGGVATLADALGGDDDLVDEAALVAEDELLRKPEPVAEGDGPVLKKACKNCTCGRAEGAMPASSDGPAAVKLDAAADLPKSSCGSCYLGDGFRCAGCPYTGMPAFKPGEKVELNLADDDI